MPNVVEYHIARLKDKDPVIRKKSARELGLIGDPAALDALEQLFRTDADPEVQKAAQEAGRAIYEKQNNDQPS